MVVVMYSVPYSHDFHSNWCGVGIFDVTDTSDFFNMMYSGSEVEFRRKDFYNNTNTVKYEEDERFEVSATMGTTHKSDIQVKRCEKHIFNIFPQVKLYPKKDNDLAKELQGQGIDTDTK